MKCESFFEELQAFLDDELDPSGRKRVADHLAECEACRELMKDLRAVSGALAKWSVPEPVSLPTAGALLARGGVSVTEPEPLSARTVTEGRAGEGRPNAARWTALRNRYLPAAAAVLVCVLGVVAFQTLRSGEVGDVAKRSSADQPAGLSANSPDAGSVTQPQPNASAPGLVAPSQIGGASNQATPNSDVRDGEQEAAGSGSSTDGSAVGATETNESREQVEEVTVTAAEAPAAPPATQPQDEEKRKEAPKEADAVVADKFDDGKTGEKAMIAAEAGEDRTMKKAEGARPQPARPAARAATSGSLIAKSGRVVLESDDPGKIAERVGGVVASQRGYVQSRSGGKTRSGGQSVELVVRVPSENFDSTIASFRSLGSVVDVSTSAVSVARELAAVDEKAGERGRENKDSRARSDGDFARSREQILDRVRMATIRLSVTTRPRTQSSALVTEPRRIDPAAAATSGSPTDRMRRAIGRGVDRLFDGAFIVLLGVLEYGPSALLVGGAVAAGIRGVRRVNCAGSTRSRATSPLS